MTILWADHNILGSNLKALEMPDGPYLVSRRRLRLSSVPHSINYLPRLSRNHHRIYHIQYLKQRVSANRYSTIDLATFSHGKTCGMAIRLHFLCSHPKVPDLNPDSGVNIRRLHGNSVIPMLDFPFNLEILITYSTPGTSW